MLFQVMKPDVFGDDTIGGRKGHAQNSRPQRRFLDCGNSCCALQTGATLMSRTKSLMANLTADVAYSKPDITGEPPRASLERPYDLIKMVENTVAAGGIASVDTLKKMHLRSLLRLMFQRVSTYKLRFIRKLRRPEVSGFTPPSGY